MDKQEFERRIEERWGRRGRRRSERGRVFGGLFMLIVGTVLLLKVSGAILFPAWFFTWPVLLIAIGLFSGVRHRFRGIGWLFPLAIGAIFLADNLSPDMHLRPYLWPILLIAAGLFVIFRPKHRRCYPDGPNDDDFDSRKNFDNQAVVVPTEAENEKNEWRNTSTDRNDVIDATAVFGGVKKAVLSKTFKGGDVTTFMGGAEINLSQADFSGKAVIDCFNMFGGTKLIVPPDWEVQSDVVAIFGGVDDKRPPASSGAPAKVLYLDGTCIFGGLEIKSY